MDKRWPIRAGSPGLLAALSLLAAPIAAPAADRLLWHDHPPQVEADISAWSLSRLLETIATATGWQVFVEPNAQHVVSTKFSLRPVGEALRLLLGDLSFALVPQLQGPPKLFVFETTLRQASQPVEPKPKVAPGKTAVPIANQLIVRVKKGTDIEALARRLGAKIAGAVEALDIYLLEFPDQAARDRAKELLAGTEGVQSVEFNYPLERPPELDPLALSYPQVSTLRPKVAGDSGRLIVGLIDTAIQPQGTELDSFLLPSISIAGGSAPSDDMPTHGTTMWEALLRGLSATLLQSESGVRILPVDVYGARPQTSTFDVAQGIYAAINAGARIINLSLGTEGDTPFLNNLIHSARQQGVLFFGAAGNEPVTTPNFPAAYPEVVAVTAGDPHGNISPYANRGAFVDVVAPGSAYVMFRNQPFIVVGTSAATAYVSGMAAGLAEQTGQPLSNVEAEIRKALAVKR